MADVGISMGDEGKGRVVPELVRELREYSGLSSPVAVVLKVNGGANSGHSVDGLKLNLLPAGVVDDSVACLALGAGVVADPRKLVWELEMLRGRGYEVKDRLLVDERVLLSDVSHRLLDLAWENYRVEVLRGFPRGSTGRGITPAYQDEVGQSQIFYGDLLWDSWASVAEKLRRRWDRACHTIEHVCGVSADVWDSFFDLLSETERRAHADLLERAVLRADAFDFRLFKAREAFRLNEEVLLETYRLAWEALRDCVGDVREEVLSALRRKRYVIGEFGQAYWLDKRAGFVPNVTASHTFTPELFQSAGVPVQAVHVVACCKAYDTKVGTHVFLSRMEEGRPLTKQLEALEFGTSTQRQRCVGWFDAVEKGNCLRYGGFDDLVINKLDALSQRAGCCEVLKVCVAYEDEVNGRIKRVPRSELARRRLKPVYMELEAWTEDLRALRSFEQLPNAAKAYVAFCVQAIFDLADEADKKPPQVRYLGVGPLPGQIIRDVPEFEDLLKWSPSPTWGH